MMTAVSPPVLYSECRSVPSFNINIISTREREPHSLAHPAPGWSFCGQLQIEEQHAMSSLVFFIHTNNWLIIFYSLGPSLGLVFPEK